MNNHEYEKVLEIVKSHTNTIIEVCRISIIKIILINIYYVPDALHILPHLIPIQSCPV